MPVNVFQCNVYGINGQQALQTPQKMAFPAANVLFREPDSATFAYNGSTRLYGVIQVLPTGLNISQPQFSVIETVEQLVTKANAS